MTNIRGIIQKIEKERLNKGKGGEIIRAAVCHLIYSMSVAKIKIDDATKIELFKTLLENFKHPNVEIQDGANVAFKAFCRTYFDGDFATADGIEEKKESEVIEHPLITKLRELFASS